MGPVIIRRMCIVPTYSERFAQSELRLSGVFSCLGVFF